jgi:hypothetical protein
MSPDRGSPHRALVVLVNQLAGHYQVDPAGRSYLETLGDVINTILTLIGETPTIQTRSVVAQIVSCMAMDATSKRLVVTEAQLSRGDQTIIERYFTGSKVPLALEPKILGELQRALTT